MFFLQQLARPVSIECIVRRNIVQLAFARTAITVSRARKYQAFAGDTYPATLCKSPQAIAVGDALAQFPIVPVFDSLKNERAQTWRALKPLRPVAGFFRQRRICGTSCSGM